MPLINHAPYPVTIAGHTIPPSGAVARALETTTAVGSLRVDGVPDEGIPLARIRPTALVLSIPAPHGGPEGSMDVERMDVAFPDPKPGTYYIVSAAAAQAAVTLGRETWDLFTPDAARLLVVGTENDVVRHFTGHDIDCPTDFLTGKPVPGWYYRDQDHPEDGWLGPCEDRSQAVRRRADRVRSR